MSQAPNPFAYAADQLDPPKPEHAGDPLGFIEERLNAVLWSRQREILKAITRHQRVAVPACFASSKSFTAGKLAAAWIETAPPGARKVVTTAAVFRQVRAILWPEIHDAHARGGLHGRLNKTEWLIDIGGQERLVAFGAATKDATRFQGHHARQGVLTIIDEADGVAQTIFDAAEGLLVTPNDRLLVVGNPWDPTGPFAAACKPGSGFHVIRISAFDTPAFTKEDVPEEITRMLISPEWVKDKQRRWGAKDPRYISKVLAHFPADAEGALIHQIWIEEAQRHKLRARSPIELGVDIGGDTGGDETVCYLRRGPVVRKLFSTRTLDTQEIADKVARAHDDFGVTVAKIDTIGIGKGVFDRLRALGKRVADVVVSRSASNPERFENQRAEFWWALRERFEPNTGDGIQIDLDPNDDELAADLTRIKFKLRGGGKIAIEAKDDMKRRGFPSPDHGDALMLCFAPVAAHQAIDEDQQIRAKDGSVMGDIMKVGF